MSDLDLRAPHPGTLSARVLQRLLDFVAARGHDPDALCLSAGLSLRALQAPGARVPYAAVERLGARAAEVTGDDNLGLHLAQQMNVALSDDPGLLMLMASATLRAGLERMVRFQRFWGDGERSTLAPAPGGLCVRFTMRNASPLARRHADECAMAEVVVGLRALLAAEVSPRAVRFRHAAPPDTREHAALFRCPLTFDAAHTELELDDAALDAPLPHAHEAYRAIFERQVERALTALPDARTTADAVRVAARIALMGGGCTLAGTARRLGVSERTLQRRLRDEGTSFGAQIDSLRREMALELLALDRSVPEVASLLGYSEASAFHHAFKRWTGRTPGRTRPTR